MKKLPFILIFLVHSSLLCRHSMLSEQAVNKKAIAIKHMITRHNYMVVGLTAIGYLHQFSLLLSGLEYFFPESQDKNNVNTSSQTVVVDNEKKEAEKRGFFAGIAHDTKQLFCTQEGWKNIGTTTFSLAGQIGAFCLFQKMADTIYHPDTLRWYLRTNVSFDKTITIIETLAKKLDLIDYMDDNERTYYRTTLYGSCVQLAGYAEDICAYMVYKAATLPRHQKMLAEGTSRYVVNYQKDIFNQLFSLLSQKNIRSADIVNLVQTYKTELKYQCHIFASIEGETENDLREQYD